MRSVLVNWIFFIRYVPGVLNAEVVDPPPQERTPKLPGPVISLSVKNVLPSLDLVSQTLAVAWKKGTDVTSSVFGASQQTNKGDTHRQILVVLRKIKK